MSEPKYNCFVIMPFAPELHYFYLYLKQYIEQHRSIRCERADARILTQPFLDKVNDYILNANVIIADCSGRNPNVFYELGIAHAHSKKVILITKDPLPEAPSDIRHFEFIQYELDKHVEFFEKLDNALHNVFFEEYKSLYERATMLANQFMYETAARVEMVSKEVFLSRVMGAERTEPGLPAMEDAQSIAQFVLPKILLNQTDFIILVQLTNWLSEKFKTP